MPFQRLLTSGTIRYAHTHITNIQLRLKKRGSVPSSSGVIKKVDHYNYDSISSERAIA